MLIDVSPWKIIDSMVQFKVQHKVKITEPDL